MLGGGAEQAVPAPAALEHLRHLELAVAAREDRRLQRPLGEVGRGGEADRPAGVRLGDVGDAGGEEHQPAVAVGVAHHPRVPHRPVVPEARAELLVERAAGQVEAEPVADPPPVVQVAAGGVADALDQPVLLAAGAGVEEVPAAVIAAHDRAGPGRVIVPGAPFGGPEAGAEMLPRHQVVADRVALAHVPVAQVGIADRLRRLQEVAVPARPVMHVPAVPDPPVVELDHPFTPVDAIEAMNARCSTR